MHKQISAFTLVELIVVITLLAILGTLGILSLVRNNSDARDAIRISDTKVLARNLGIKINSEQVLSPEVFINSSLSQNIFSSGTILESIDISSIPYYVGIGEERYFGKNDFTDPVSGAAYPIAVIQADNKLYYQVAASLESGNSVVHGSYFTVDSGDLEGIIKSFDSETAVINGGTDLPY